MQLLKIQLICLTLCMSISLASAQQGFVLNGKLADVPGSALAYLQYNGKKDSAQIVNGEFTFKGKLTIPAFAWLVISKNGKMGVEPFPFYLEPTTLTLSSPDSLRNAVMKGGELDKQRKQFNALLTAAQEKSASYTADAKGKIGPEPRNISDAQRNARFELQKSVALSFIKDNPDALYDIYLIKNLAGPDSDMTQVENYLKILSPRVRNSELAKQLIVDLKRLKTTAVGEMAPEFSMPDTAGKLVSLKSFRGKYVLLDFWASWCTPCRAENPNLVKSYAIYHPKGLEILGVSLDKLNGKAAWIKAIADDHLTWTHVSDLKASNQAARLYSISSIPQNCLIDPNGKIVAKNLRAEKLGETLSKIFK